jgi:hypothetical protein
MLECRLYLRRECLLNPPPSEERARSIAGSLLALAAPKLIESFIGGIATLLKKAGDAETSQIHADRFTSLYLADDKQALSLSPELRCLVALWFETDAAPPADDDIAARLRGAGMLPQGALLAGAFEATIEQVPDRTAFHLQTRYFCARQFIGDRGKKDRDYVVSLSLTAPDATPEGKTFALGTIDLGTVKRAGEVKPVDSGGAETPRLGSNLMPWSQISAASKTAYERDVAARQAAGRLYMPVTFRLTISETADGNAFLQAIGNLLGGAADDISKAVTKRLLPEEAAKADAEAAEGAAKLYEDELAAEIDVEKSKKALAKGSEEDKARLALELELSERKLSRRRSLREAAGLPPRHS